MARIRSGDDEAFGCLYDRYAGSLLAFCHHMLGTREEAEDALQHVFVAAHRQLRLGSPPQQIKPWLYAVARNRCLSVLRARRETVALDDVREPAGGADVARDVEQREDIREILADVAALPHEQREALVLAEIGAMSHDEIALTLGVRKDKVKALVFQARQSLMVSREARETTCRDIQERLAVLRGGALRRGAIRRHVDRCPACAAFGREVRRQRSLLAEALPALPAAALKSAILAAASAGGAGGGLVAAGGVSVVAATGGSSTAIGGGLTGLGSSALFTKVLAVGAVAGIAVGGGTAVVRLQHAPARVTAAAPARAPSTTPATLKAASISAPVPTGRPSGPSASGGRGHTAPAERGSGIHRQVTGQPTLSLARRQTVRPPSDSAEVRGTGSDPAASTVSAAGPGLGAPGTLGNVQPGSPPRVSEAAKPESPPAVSKGAKPDAPPGQSNSAKPDAPPGQSNSAKPDAPPGQSNSAKPDAPPGESNSAKPDAPPGESDSARPDAPPGESDSAKPDTPPGASNRPRPGA